MRAVFDELLDSGLSLLQGAVIAYVEENTPCRESDLVDYLDRPRTQIHTLLVTLRAKGFLTQELVYYHEARRRTPLYTLTEDSKVFLDKLRNSIPHEPTI